MRGAIIGLLVFFVIGFILLVTTSGMVGDRTVVLSLLVGMVFTVGTAWGVWQIIRRFEPEFHKLLLLTLMLPWAGQDS